MKFIPDDAIEAFRTVLALSVSYKLVMAPNRTWVAYPSELATLPVERVRELFDHPHYRSHSDRQPAALFLEVIGQKDVGTCEAYEGFGNLSIADFTYTSADGDEGDSDDRSDFEWLVEYASLVSSHNYFVPFHGWANEETCEKIATHGNLTLQAVAQIRSGAKERVTLLPNKVRESEAYVLMEHTIFSLMLLCVKNGWDVDRVITSAADRFARAQSVWSVERPEVVVLSNGERDTRVYSNMPNISCSVVDLAAVNRAMWAAPDSDDLFDANGEQLKLWQQLAVRARDMYQIV